MTDTNAAALECSLQVYVLLLHTTVNPLAQVAGLTAVALQQVLSVLHNVPMDLACTT